MVSLELGPRSTQTQVIPGLLALWSSICRYCFETSDLTVRGELPHHLDIGRIAPGRENSSLDMDDAYLAFPYTGTRGVPVSHGCRTFGKNTTNLLHCSTLS